MTTWPIRTTLLRALREVGLDLSARTSTRVVRRWDDAVLLASAHRSLHQIEFGLLERQGEVTVNVLHCALSFDVGSPVNLSVISEAEPELNGAFALDSFADLHLQNILAFLRKVL